MRNAKRYLVAVGLLLFAVQSTSAQQEVILDHVTNSNSGLFLIAGRTHVFKFRFENIPASPCTTYAYNVNNGFVISSPDGATWDHTTGEWTESFLSQTSWFTFGVNSFDNPVPPSVEPGDGASPDYVGAFAASITPPSGMQPGYNDIALEIEIATNISDTNLHICVDRSELGRLNTWQWFGYFGCTVLPVWAGQKCFTIKANCCSGRTGNIDLDPFGNIDIADMTFLIDHLFINFPPLPCRDQANVNADPEGRVDIADLTLLLDHLFRDFADLAFCE